MAITFVNSWSAVNAAGTSLTISTNGASGSSPTNSNSAQVGDVYVWAVEFFGTLAGTPSGWSVAVSGFEGPSSLNIVVFYKVVASGDINASFTANGFGGGIIYPVGGIICFRGVDNVTPIDVAGAGSFGTSATPTAGSITLANSNDALCWFDIDFNSEATVSTKPTGYTSLWAFTYSNGNSAGGIGSYKLSVASGATGTVSGSNANADTSWGAVLVALSPAAPGPILPVRPRRRIVRRPQQRIYKPHNLRIPRAIIQPPAAKLGFAPRDLISRATHARKNPPKQKLIKSSMPHVRTRLPQPPAAKLGIWPKLLSTRIQRKLKPSLKWRAVKSIFRRWQFIQPPAAKLGVWPHLLSSRIQHRLKLLKSKFHQDEQDVSRRAVAPTAIIFMRRLRSKLTKRIKRVSRLEVAPLSGRPIATGLRPFVRRAKAITIVSRRKIRRSRLIAAAPAAFRRAATHLKAQPRKLQSRLHLRTPTKIIQPPAAALGFAVTRIADRHRLAAAKRLKLIREAFRTRQIIQPPAAALGVALHEIVHKARPVKLSRPWRVVKSTFKKIWLAQPPAANLGVPPPKLADRHRLILRPSSKLVKSIMRSPRRQIQPSAAALGMAVRSIVHKAHPVKLGKAWKTIKSSFKLGELQKPALAALLAFVPIKLRKAHRLVLLKPSKLIKDTFHIPRALIQPPAAKLGIALRNIIRKRHPMAFSRPFQLVKMRMRAPRDVIQPPAAKLGVWPHLLNSRIQHRVKPSLRWRIIKSAFKRWSFIQPPAARLGVAVRKLIPKAKLRALPKPWRTVKSLFKRPDKIIPPPIVAGANAFVPKVHSSKLRAKIAARSARRRLRLAAPAAFIRLRAIRRIRRVSAQQRRPARQRLRLSAPSVFIRLRAIRQIRRATTQQRSTRRRLHLGAPLTFIRLRAIRKIRQLPTRQVRHRLSTRIAQAPAALFKLRHVRAVRKAQQSLPAKAHRRILSGPTSLIHFMRAHRRRAPALKPRPLRRSPRLSVFLGTPTVASLLAFLRARPHGPRAPFKPFKWLRISRWLRQWRFGPPPPPSAELPRVIFNARLDQAVEFAATLDRDPAMMGISNRMITIDARL